MNVDGVTFRPANSSDWPDIWPVFTAVVAAGDTYAYPPETTESEARDLWMQPGSDRRFTYVATQAGKVVATSYLKPNGVGLSDHICNAGWMVAPESSGQGIGRVFAEYVIGRAVELGFAGMQFNAVVASNTRAIGLWQSMGFQIVGTVPDAFRHKRDGMTPVHIMYRDLHE